MAMRARGAPMPYKALAGAVPCPGGWLVMGGRLQGISLAPQAPQVFATFQDLVDWKPDFQVIALHAPMGLLDKPTQGGRRCDREARALLGRPRSGAVGSAPTREALAAKTYEAAARANEGLSPVVWSRFAHYREVDGEMSPYWQRTIYEIHPELSFYDLNHEQPLRHGKHTVGGITERRAALVERLSGFERVLDLPVKGAHTAHILDAAAALWTARRITARAADRMPQDPEWDDNGMRMEIWR